MTNPIPDLAARLEALNPENSYIVQAPAGSGKTELLTQRFLRLLAYVQEPESIVALTFTRKAAREMRDRVLLALEMASKNEKNKQPKTDELAQMVLAQDKRYGWNLLTSFHRLRIQTIDSLCANLSAQMPLLSRGVPYANILDNPSDCYQEAAHRCLTEAQVDMQYQSAVERLLLHLGNRYERCIGLLADMLSWREQWLSPLVMAQSVSSVESRKQLEKALKRLSEEAEAQIERLFSDEMKAELTELMLFSAEKSSASLALAAPFKKGGKQLDWRQAIPLLLTKDYRFRSRVDKSIGFPSPSQTKNAEEKQLWQFMKERMENILSDLKENESIRQALENYAHCPKAYYSDEQWEILDALISLLPLLVAQLKLVFMETNSVDFSEVTEQAFEALGGLDEPTDLAFYLDHRIQHLLVDEFQDTSLRQFCLLEKLTQGWGAGDGRTLFLVGDPMQSIYRFREADVSLFLRAREQGIGQIQLLSLRLTCNFRSKPELIIWVNRCFQGIFPSQDDMTLSAVKHHTSQPGQATYSSSGKINFYVAETAEGQALRIVQQIKVIPENESVAILVHFRSQLKTLIPALQKANIIFQGVDIDPLATRSYIQDAYFLTQALLQPENHLAWLSVLRAPWCGLTVSDLFDLKRNNPLSQEAQTRFNHVKNIFTIARQTRQSEPLSLWVEKTWRKLGGHHCLSVEEHDDMEKFWTLLDEYRYEDFDIPKSLATRINRLFSNVPNDSRLQIMTIHKSKGLEFDHVILPHLESGLGRKDYPLLQHWVRPTKKGKHDFVLAVMKSVEMQQDDIYHYLHYVDEKKALFERQRLLYVALTRARSHLHLLAVQGDNTRNTHSFFKWIEPHIPQTTSIQSNMALPSDVKNLKRLKLSYFSDITTEEVFLRNLPISIAEGEKEKAIMGTFIHEQIQYCAENHLKHPSEIDASCWKSRLIELGIYAEKSQEEAIIQAHLALERLYQDERGLWIIQEHQQEKNEYALNYRDENGEIKTAILDRVFIANGICWIIDYKITQEILPQGNLEKHFAPLPYQKQLEHYAKLFGTIEKNYPIHLGLYYPLTQSWIAWNYHPMLR